ncbi:MAG: hypothetical protein JWL58_4141 [Streptosporangiaceae bacterium]|jgi:hypothetical protein|nr:hypothetical protein [Streptosporangiaceae bacterium]
MSAKPRWMARRVATIPVLFFGTVTMAVAYADGESRMFPKSSAVGPTVMGPVTGGKISVVPYGMPLDVTPDRSRGSAALLQAPEVNVATPPAVLCRPAPPWNGGKPSRSIAWGGGAGGIRVA